MSRILIVTLGGTICSSKDKDTIKLKGALDKSFFEKLKVKDELSFFTPVLYSSENADEDFYRQALCAVINKCEEDHPDAILILHGTDSMAFFAQLAVRVLSFLNLPVVITGSKCPADDPKSDAVNNVKYSLGLLGAAASGHLGALTFGVVYTDDMMEDTVFIPASRVTDANFAGDYGKFPGKPRIKELSRDEAQEWLSSPVKKVLTIPAVPGYPYSSVDPGLYDAILIEAYHSGTSSSRDLPGLIRRAFESGIPCFLGPVHKEIKAMYESTRLLIDAGAVPLYDIPFEGCWAELVIKQPSPSL